MDNLEILQAFGELKSPDLFEWIHGFEHVPIHDGTTHTVYYQAKWFDANGDQKWRIQN